MQTLCWIVQSVEYIVACFSLRTHTASSASIEIAIEIGSVLPTYFTLAKSSSLLVNLFKY